MGLVIINGDDFGASSSVNEAIIEAHTKGILTSTTIMANMPFADEALNLAKTHPALGVGIHLNITEGKPLHGDLPSLTDKQGNFKNIDYYIANEYLAVNPDELYQEWQAQINYVVASGIIPSHLDSHHHINKVPIVSDVFEALAKEYQLPVRKNFIPKDTSLKSSKHLTLWFDEMAKTPIFWREFQRLELISLCKQIESIEVMTHPNLPLHGTNNTLSELTDHFYREALTANHDIILGSYHDLL